MSAQPSPDVIYCNEYQNVALVMSAPIAQGVTGSEEFVFSYNKAAVDSLGLLQGKPGGDSNLLIRTIDGSLYSYILRYKDSLSEFVHFIEPRDRINSIPREKEAITEKHEVPKTGNNDKKSYYEKLSGYYLKRHPQNVATRRKAKLKLEVQGLYYYRDEMFMVIEIRNRSQIDYEIEDVSLAKIHGIKGRKSSYQKLVLKAQYRQDYPQWVLRGGRARFVMVYPKFTLGDHDKLQLDVTERKGNRYLKLDFD